MTDDNSYKINIENTAKLVRKNFPDGIEDLANSIKEQAEVVLEGEVISAPRDNSQALLEVREAEERQRKLREQYEKDRTFFENHVLQKTRSAGEIQEDFIRVLHPDYREKFIKGIARYGTIPAAIKYMRDVYGLNLRSDLIRRMTLLIPGFKCEVDDALAEYQATLHMEMHRRAVEGVDKTIYHQGSAVGTEKVYSDSLLVKMVDTYNPEYKEAKTKESKSGNTINVQIIKDFHNYKQ